jgi:Fe-S-cluster containining protein
MQTMACEKESWFAQGLRFECTGCGNCCTGGPGFIWISEVELGRLSSHLQQPLPQVQQQYCRKVGGRVSLKEKPPNQHREYDCVFLRSEALALPDDGSEGIHRRRQCQIYSVRPLQCRTWPFWSGLLAGPRAWEEAARRCPGMNRGRLYAYEEIIALRDAQDWP